MLAHDHMDKLAAGVMSIVYSYYIVFKVRWLDATAGKGEAVTSPENDSQQLHAVICGLWTTTTQQRQIWTHNTPSVQSAAKRVHELKVM